MWLPLMRPPIGDLACSPGMCPDWEPNQQPFGSQAGTQSTEPHQPGPGVTVLKRRQLEQGRGRLCHATLAGPQMVKHRVIKWEWKKNTIKMKKKEEETVPM